jgi:hypothetical protein
MFTNSTTFTRGSFHKHRSQHSLQQEKSAAAKTRPTHSRTAFFNGLAQAVLETLHGTSIWPIVLMLLGNWCCVHSRGIASFWAVKHQIYVCASTQEAACLMPEPSIKAA